MRGRRPHRCGRRASCLRVAAHGSCARWAASGLPLQVGPHHSLRVTRVHDCCTYTLIRSFHYAPTIPLPLCCIAGHADLYRFSSVTYSVPHQAYLGLSCCKCPPLARGAPCLEATMLMQASWGRRGAAPCPASCATRRSLSARPRRNTPRQSRRAPMGRRRRRWWRRWTWMFSQNWAHPRPSGRSWRVRGAKSCPVDILMTDSHGQQLIDVRLVSCSEVLRSGGWVIVSLSLKRRQDSL